MFKSIMRLFGDNTGFDLAGRLQQGAQIIDVRTPAEFRTGHIAGSRNIPLQSLPQHTSKIDKKKPVITCCRSGARSENAKRFLESRGFKDVVNGGGWKSLERRINKAKTIQ